jgi:signal transduction histidine kinase
MRATAHLLLLAAIGFAPAVARAEPPPERDAPTLTRIAAIRALAADAGARGYRVRVRGIITHFDEIGQGLLFLHDGEAGQFVEPPEPGGDVERVFRTLRHGDVVEIEGRTVRGGFAPNVKPEVIRKVGTAAMPLVKHLSYPQLLSGRHDCDYVEVEGVVQRAWLPSDPSNRTFFAEVAIEGGFVRASFWGHAREDLERFIDARVRLRGNVGTLFGQTGQLRGVSLFVGRTNDVVVLAPPPEPYSLPVRSIRSIYNYSSDGEMNRRMRVRGVVTSQVIGRPVQVSDFPTSATFRDVRHVLYLRDDESGARIETEQDLRVRPGHVVEAVGFPAVTPGKPILRNAIIRVVGMQPPASAVALTPEKVLNAEHDAELVRMDGHLLGVLRNPTALVLVVKMGETVFDANLDPALGGQLAEIRPGSAVSVTGVYAYQWGPPPSFRLFLRSPDDVVVLSAAPWWTLQHTGVLVAMLALAGIVAGSWVYMVAKQKRQQFQAILTERNRVARELHDTLEQGLAGIALQLEAVTGSLETSPSAARQSLDVARQMLRYSLEEARRSVLDLRSEALESRGLAGALATLARQMTIGTTPRVDVRIEGPVRRLDVAQEHHLLRIGLEALTNALKHAQATHIDMLLQFDVESITLVVSDDGRGLGEGPLQLPGGHFGLRGVRERVDKLAGTVEFDSRPSEGTRVIVTVPIDREPRPLPKPTLREIWRRS